MMMHTAGINSQTIPPPSVLHRLPFPSTPIDAKKNGSTAPKNVKQQNKLTIVFSLSAVSRRMLDSLSWTSCRSLCFVIKSVEVSHSRALIVVLEPFNSAFRLPSSCVFTASDADFFPLFTFSSASSSDVCAFLASTSVADTLGTFKSG
jgi:hypothetical protein